MIFAHKFFGEGFTAFKLGGDFVGTKDFQTMPAEFIDNAGGQGNFGADHSQINSVFLGDIDQGTNIGGLNIEATRYFGNAGVSRGTEEPVNFGGLFQFPGDGMFSSAAAYYEDAGGSARLGPLSLSSRSCHIEKLISQL